MEKKLSCELFRLQTQYPEADIEVGSEDEHRLGLQPVLRRVWTAVGEQPVAGVKIQYNPSFMTMGQNIKLASNRK